MTGRNDPCPCGSGRKYKKCHLAADEASREPLRAEAVPSPLHALDERVIEKIFRFAEEELSLDFDDFFDECFEPGVEMQLAVPWLAYTEPVGGRTLAEQFLERNRLALSPREIAWIEAVNRSWMSAWEVTAVDRGRGMSLIDLLTGERRDVRETMASRSVEVHDALFARVVDCMGESLLAGVHPITYPPLRAAAIVTALRQELDVESEEPIPPERLRDIEMAATLLHLWEEEQGAPMLQNTDGDPILLTTDRFRFDLAHRQEVAARLASLEGAELETGAGHVAILDGDSLIAHLEVGNGELLVETNSLERADEMKNEIETALAGLVRWESRSHTDPLSDAFSDEPLPPEPERDEETAAVLRAYKEKHYAAWLDDPLPLLNGRTPRQAVTSPEGRKQLLPVLKHIARIEATFPEAERFDVGMLYAALGIRRT